MTLEATPEDRQNYIKLMLLEGKALSIDDLIKRYKKDKRTYQRDLTKINRNTDKYKVSISDTQLVITYLNDISNKSPSKLPIPSMRLDQQDEGDTTNQPIQSSLVGNEHLSNEEGVGSSPTSSAKVGPIV